MIVSNIFWRSPLHCKKVVCCDVRCERRGLWKTSVTCTAICSQIDRGIPFSVYPSSAPHPGRYNRPYWSDTRKGYRPYWSDTRKGYSTGHTGQTQGRGTGHTGQTQGRGTGHTGQTQGRGTGHIGQTQGRGTVQTILVRHKEGVQYRSYWSDDLQTHQDDLNEAGSRAEEQLSQEVHERLQQTKAKFP